MKIYFYKIAFILFVFFLGVSNSFSQSLQFVNEPQSAYSANIDSAIDIYISTQIKNSSQSNINLKIKSEILSLSYGHSYDVCWNGNCSPPTTLNWESSNSFALAADSITPANLFYSHYYAYFKSGSPSEGSGSIRYTFFNADNPDDNLTFEVAYSFTTSSVFETLANSQLKVDFSDNKVLRIFSNNNASLPYKITIYSVLGIKISEAQFDDFFEKDLMDFGNQVFLYQISQQGKIVGLGKIQ